MATRTSGSASGPGKRTARKGDTAPRSDFDLGTRELDVVRRAHWNQLRAGASPHDARRFKGARWALLKRPEDLTDRQHDALLALKRAGGAV